MKLEDILITGLAVLSGFLLSPFICLAIFAIYIYTEYGDY